MSNPKNRIREFRERLGLSAPQLGEKVGTTTRQIYRLENGERRLAEDWMKRFASVFNCEPGDLLIGGVYPPARQDDVEPYCPPAELAGVASMLASSGVKLYRVIGDGLTFDPRIEIGAVIAVDQGDRDVATLELHHVVLIEERETLVLGLHIGFGTVLTSRGGKKWAISIDDPNVAYIGAIPPIRA